MIIAWVESMTLCASESRLPAALKLDWGYLKRRLLEFVWINDKLRSLLVSLRIFCESDKISSQFFLLVLALVNSFSASKYVLFARLNLNAALSTIFLSLATTYRFSHTAISALARSSAVYSNTN